MGQLPALSPLILHDAICSTCGEQLSRTITKNKAGKPLSVRYTCDDCGYWTETDQRMSTMQHIIRDEPKEEAK